MAGHESETCKRAWVRCQLRFHPLSLTLGHTLHQSPLKMTTFKSSSLHHLVTTVVRVGDVSYLISGECYTSITSDIADDEDLQITASTPVTVINIQNTHAVDSSWLEGKIKSFLTTDDVFNEGFLGRVLLKGSSSSQRPTLSDGAKAVLAKCGATASFIESESNIPSGPLMILASKPLRLCQVFRLYPDPQLAFMYGTVPSEDRQRYGNHHSMMQKITCPGCQTNKFFGKLSSHRSRSDTSTFTSIFRPPLSLPTTQR